MVSGRWDRGKGFFTTPEPSACRPRVRAKYDSWSTTARLVEPIGDDLTMQLRGLAFEDNRVLRFAGATPASRARTSARAWSAAGRGSSMRSPMASGATSTTG